MDAFRQLLVINPNTSASVSQLLLQYVQLACGQEVEVLVATARFGAPYIADEASFAIAGHATLDAWAAALAQGIRPDAVLIGCFGDPGLLALRECSPVPVSGLAEAAAIEAAQAGRFAIVTGGARWRPMLQRLLHGIGLGEQLVDVLTVAPSGAQLASDPEGATRLLTSACQEAAQLPGVRSVILGGAGLAGMAARVQPQLDVPVIDSVAAGARHAMGRVAQAPERSRAGFDIAWTGLSRELAALGLAGDD